MVGTSVGERKDGDCMEGNGMALDDVDVGCSDRGIEDGFFNGSDDGILLMIIGDDVRSFVS